MRPELNRGAMLAVALAVVAAAYVWVFPRLARRNLVHRTPALAAQVYAYRCAACGATFSMTRGEVLGLIRDGKTLAVEGELLRIPCPACGKVEARLNEAIPP